MFLIDCSWEEFLITFMITAIIIILFILTLKKTIIAKIILGIILLLLGGYGFLKQGVQLIDVISLIQLVINGTCLICGILLLVSEDIDSYVRGKCITDTDTSNKPTYEKVNKNDSNTEIKDNEVDTENQNKTTKLNNNNPNIKNENTIINKTTNNTLPNNLRGRSIHNNIIPTVCNLKNMLNKLAEYHGDFSKLKQWEKRSYKAYNIEDIKSQIIYSPETEWVKIIRKHILDGIPSDFGASCIDIYLVAYVSETYGKGKEKFYEYIKTNNISDKINSAQAIWQVGKGDGVYLDILNDDGTIKDWDFINKWTKTK